jgi:PLP dependent protein
MTALPLSGSVPERIAQIRETLPPSVRLIAITKQVAVQTMREAYHAGIRDFGESKIQELEEKQAQLRDLDEITWHFIGHLQANKAQRALQLCQWIHSVDSLKLAQRLNRLAETGDHFTNVCLQVKPLPDPNKYGWTVPELLADLDALNQCEFLNIKGLMTISPQNLEEEKLHSFFRQAYDLGKNIQEQNFSHIHIQEFSMGMSGDYQVAVEAGATMVRLGRILFGDRL